MRWNRQQRRRRDGAVGMELAGALSIASQMAWLCPPGCGEVLRRELSRGPVTPGPSAGAPRPAAHGPVRG